jgi:hypothetical protein
MGRPTSFAADAFAGLSSIVSTGWYLRFESQSQIPSSVSRIAGGVANADFRFAEVAASVTTEAPPSLGGITPAPCSPVYRVSVVRADCADAMRPHFNRDQVLVFGDARGNCWQLHQKDVPDHYLALSNDSGLSAALAAYGAIPHTGTIASIL